MGLPVPETPSPGQAPQPSGETDVVGKPWPRVDAYERVSGAAIYPSDVVLSTAPSCAALTPHARVRRVDPRRAQAMPGVRAVIGPDTPKGGLVRGSKDRQHQRCGELRGVAETTGGALRIGALTPISEVAATLSSASATRPSPRAPRR